MSRGAVDPHPERAHRRASRARRGHLGLRRVERQPAAPLADRRAGLDGGDRRWHRRCSVDK
ncbi:hypothetical protein [Ornithinimicrobium kibberense]|uniref:hypothetical protein n=1 Tax=Ornithinimicrobium kibberense TaxID=282060 RepID=UPI0036191A3C